ncbi:sugar-transfer associated ATP-grasp domain-containing protein [Carboxylicivirga marina]|uniref:Alpha-L-glutamate ligase-related protein ATP-grasp domain-containing protein n=1 Tax=Carboxylicivirga marina TaxID=2800988 RepID=A0ABS1HQH4_9BACT|nr:sugar-transfer associated ATP-grasp domain-containing protein [Carboxylicivirga marina]MBK3519933.1 hypothetical protein [Carboxylicivirga marina]
MRMKHWFWKKMSSFIQKVHRYVNYKYMKVDNARLANNYSHKEVSDTYKLKARDISEYRQYWAPLDTHCNVCHVKNVALFTGSFDKRVVPSDVYFGIIEPLLNNRKYSLAFEDKCRIDWINGVEHVPLIFVRNIHGVYYQNDGSTIEGSQIDLDGIFKDIDSVVVKKSIEVHGGKGVEIFEKTNGELQNQINKKLSIEYLEEKYEKDFLIQERLVQHDYYKLFNPSSLNTFRIVTYRSVNDNVIHILYSYLRIGAPNMLIDNVSSGGVFVCLNQDGSFAENGMTKKSEIKKQAGTQAPFKELGKAFKIEEIWEYAKYVASYHYNCRLLGLDIALDDKGSIRLIETNTSDIGMEGQQYLLGPLFHKFTDEVIDFCHDQIKLSNKYHTYGS